MLKRTWHRHLCTFRVNKERKECQSQTELSLLLLDNCVADTYPAGFHFWWFCGKDIKQEVLEISAVFIVKDIGNEENGISFDKILVGKHSIKILMFRLLKSYL